MTGLAQWGVPWSVTHAPEPHDWCTARPRISLALDRAVAAAPVVEVAAPGGFGKTVALAEWARSHEAPVAWVSLGVHSRNPERLASALAHALRTAIPSAGGWGEVVPQVPETAHSSALVAGWVAALDQVSGQVVLVVDDCHRVPGLLERGPLAALIRAAPRALRCILATRTPAPALARSRANGDAVLIDSDTLRMHADEVAALARAAGLDLAPGDAEDLVAGTGGWPLAVGLDLITPHAELPRAEGTIRAYLETEVLDRLPSDARRLVLATSLMTQFDAYEAAELSGIENVGAVLDDLLQRGLFLSRSSAEPGRTSYRWHERFAQECRGVLEHDDPLQFREISRATVRLLWFGDPISALRAARLGGSADLLVGLLEEHWLALLLEGDHAELRTSLDALSPVHRSAPVSVVLDAALSDLNGEREMAQLLLHRAGALPADRSARLAVTLGRLLMEDSPEALARACDELDALVRTDIEPGAPVHVPALFLLGWSEMRLRRAPVRALSLLRSVARKAGARGHSILARRAHANAAFAAAFIGDFEVAVEELSRLGPTPRGHDLWEVYDGGIREFTEGWVAYWRGDLAQAEERFSQVVERHGVHAYAPLARVMLIWTVCAEGDLAKVERTSLMLREVPGEDGHGVPWGFYSQLAAAKVLLARSTDPQAIARAVHDAVERDDTPVICLEAAGMLQRLGRVSEAVTQLQRLSPLERQPVYVQVGALVANALVQRRRGEAESAHRLLERSLGLASPAGLRLAFQQPAPGLRSLLNAHLERGTDHADFLVDVLGGGAEQSPSRVVLSSREQEVMSYMRGTLSNAEIAEALHVSVNTVKTHQRSIYRKLGVTGRREAVRVAVGGAGSR